MRQREVAMTKFVLNSGGIKRESELKKKFHLELIKGLAAEPKFLMCNFAQPREQWEKKFPGYCDAIREDLSPSAKPTFSLAMPEAFAGQAKDSDILYFHGGDDHLVQYWLRQFDLAEAFAGKVVATNSGSSDALAASFWTCDWRQCMNGLGILPIKFIPHFESTSYDDDPRGPIDWQKAYEELAGYGDPKLPIHALREGEFMVFER